MSHRAISRSRGALAPLVLLCSFLCALPTGRPQEQAPTTNATPSVSTPPLPPGPPLELLFSNSTDLHDRWGQVRIGATPIRKLSDCAPADFITIGTFPMPDGSWETFGQQLGPEGAGTSMYLRKRTWKLIRATSTDGVNLQDEQTVYEAGAAAWTPQTAIAYNPDAKEYLLLRFKMDRDGFAYTPFFSRDGLQWHEEKAVFHDGDALSLFWSPVLHRFVCVSKSLQPYRKHIVDHGGTTWSLHDPSLHDRRVLVFRSSPDGRRWEPSVSQHDLWDKDHTKSAVPRGFMTMPDADDPPDLEFYSGDGFWYKDRAYAVVLNYAASPVMPHKHGPHLDNELWTSPDGLAWERPARGMNELDGFPAIVRLETAPVLLNGKLVFVREPRAPNQLLGVPEDRLSFVTARTNGEFSTKLFTMPAADLELNAAVPAPERAFAKAQAYVMVGILDEAGKPVAGFEPEKCLIQRQDRAAIPLRWQGRSARELAGQRLQLRIFLRSADVYAVKSAASQPAADAATR